jgi:hypothetical protein
VKSIFAMAVGFACAGAFAATGIGFLPANPTPADTIRISFWSAGTEVLTMNLPGAPLARTIQRFRFQ